MLSPVPGSSFTSSSVIFNWSAGSATAYFLLVGSSPNGSDIYSSGIVTVLSNTVNNIPTDGRTIYVTLGSQVNGSWIDNNYTYNAFNSTATPTPTPAPTPTPTPTPTLTPTPTPTNTFLTGLYAYYKLDEASNSTAIDAAHGRTLGQYNGIVGSAAGVINTSRYFPWSACFFRESWTDFAPGANHFFATFWTKAATLTYSYDASFLGRFSLPYAEWLVWYNISTHKVRFSVSATGNTATTIDSTTALTSTTSWYFVAVGWDGTHIKISVNGEPYATASFAGPVFNGGACKFVLGSENGGNPWVGEIDEVAIWIGRNDLSISEVQQLYNKAAGLPFSSFH